MPLRIAILSPVWFPVPPTGYGGTERVVSLLADSLVEAGHDVTLFASGDSHSKAKLVSVFDVAPSAQIGHSIPEIHHALACLERAGEFDIINDHSGPPAAVMCGLVGTPAVHTLHGPLDGPIAPKVYRQIANVAPRVGLISISLNQRKPEPGLPWIANCPNAIDISVYPCQDKKSDYLVFVGRMNPDKGAHHAIQIANETGLPLKLAGKMQDLEEKEYFNARIKPHLSERIEYMGEVTHDEKVALLQNARLTLFPIEWEEPFGLVPIESMACGTPVLATRYGAVPEVIASGIGGIVVDHVSDMVAMIDTAAALDPLDCRRYVEESFRPERMVADYVAAYERAISGEW